MRQYLRQLNKIEIVFFTLSVFMIFEYIALATWANKDLSEGRFALFMDERITFDGVRRILYPESITDFMLSIVHGGDHRYGRSLWNSIALFSFIPERIWGVTGQIIASRMTQAIILSSSFILLHSFTCSNITRCGFENFKSFNSCNNVVLPLPILPSIENISTILSLLLYS